MPAALISLKREKKKQGEGGAKKKKHGKRKRTGAHSGPSLKPAIIQCGVIVSVEVEEETVQGAARPSGAEFAEEQDSWESSRPFFFFASQKANGKRRPALRSGRCWPLAGPPERMEETTSGMWKVPLIVALGPTRGLPPGRDPQTHTQTHTCTMP